MGGLLKKLLYVVLGIVVLIAVAVVAFVVLFDPNDYRDRISAEVKRATGRDLVIEGDLGLSVFPWLAIDVGKTRLGNAPGFGDEPFASFERARLSVRLLPMLLHREVSVGTASLDSLHLNLEVAKNGRSNWQDLIEASEATPQAQAPAGATQTARLEIAGIDVSDASLTYTDAQAGTSYRISKLHVRTGRIRDGEPLPIDAGLDFELQPAGLSGDLAVETEIALDSEAGTVAFHDARVQTLGLDVAAEVEPFSYGGEPTPVATIRIAAFSLKDLMRRLGIDPIVTADPDALGKISFGATARVSTAAIALDDVQLVVDDTTLRGIQVSIRLCDVYDLLNGGDLLVPILPFDHLCNHFLFSANHLLRRELTGAGMNPSRSNLEFSTGHSFIQRGANLSERQLAHSTP